MKVYVDIKEAIEILGIKKRLQLYGTKEWKHVFITLLVIAKDMILVCRNQK